MSSDIMRLSQEYDLFFQYPYLRLILPVMIVYAVVFSYILWKKQNPGQKISTRKQFMAFLKIFGTRFQYFLYGALVIVGSWNIVSFIVGLVLPVSPNLSLDVLTNSGSTLGSVASSSQSTMRSFIPLLEALKIDETKILFGEIVVSIYVNIGILMTLGVLNKDFYRVGKILFILVSFFLFSVAMLDGAALYI